ncbi:MAG: hypothetical protein R3C49_21185 [Planctomycetaceae bacterium]
MTGLFLQTGDSLKTLAFVDVTHSNMARFDPVEGARQEAADALYLRILKSHLGHESTANGTINCDCQQGRRARSVLMETLNVLGAFREQLVVVGGWVPDLLYPGKQHIRSIDVDLAVPPDALRDDAYSTILARLKEAGFRHHSPPTHFTRDTDLGPVKLT